VSPRTRRKRARRTWRRASTPLSVPAVWYRSVCAVVDAAHDAVVKAETPLAQTTMLALERALAAYHPLSEQP